MKMSMVNTPLAMRVLPLAPSLDDTVSHAAATCPKLCGAQSPPLVLTPTSASLPQPVKDMGPPSNKTEDQVRHLLLVSCPGSPTEPHDEVMRQ